MPAWITVVVAFATPALAFLGVVIGNRVSRKSALELDQWRRREETMRLLRWAVESAASENVVLADAGLAVLDELIDAEMLQPQDKAMVEAVVDVVTSAAGAVAYAGLADADYAADDAVVETEERSDG